MACKPHQSQSWEKLGAGWHSYGFHPPGPQKPSLGLSMGMVGAHRWHKAREVVLGNHSMGTRGSLGTDAPEQLGVKPPNDSWSSFIHSSFIYWNTLRDYALCARHCAGPGYAMVSNRDTVPASWSLYSTSLGTRKVLDVVLTVESCRSYLLNVYPGLFLIRPSLIQILEDSSWDNGTHPPQTRLLHLIMPPTALNRSSSKKGRDKGR